MTKETYSCHCTACGEVWEKDYPFDAEDEGVICPACHSDEVRVRSVLMRRKELKEYYRGRGNEDE